MSMVENGRGRFARQKQKDEQIELFKEDSASAFGMGPRLTARYAAVRGARAMSFEQESASSTVTVHVHIQDKV